MSGELLELIKQSWDCDSYQDRPLETERMLRLFETVRWVPSAANVQPWEFYLVQNRQQRRELDSCLLDPFLRPREPAGVLERAPMVVVVAVDRKRSTARHGELGEQLLAVQDSAAAIVCLRLAAAEEGLGSAWAREVDLPRVAAALALPRGQRPVALLSFGFPAHAATGVPGLAISDCLHVLSD